MVKVECVDYLSIFCFKQKTADELRISDWSSDVCSSDLDYVGPRRDGEDAVGKRPVGARRVPDRGKIEEIAAIERHAVAMAARAHAKFGGRDQATARGEGAAFGADEAIIDAVGEARIGTRSEEHTSELQSLMRISYAVFCLKK